MRPEEALWRYKLSLLCLLLLSLEGLEGKTCDKFSTFSDKVVGVVDEVCYYGFSNTQLWTGADALCQGEGTHLVHLQTTAKQQAVFNVLGSNFGQHWTGLRNLNSVWAWYYNSSYNVDATNDVSGRWDGPTYDPCAYTMTSNQVLLKSTSLYSSYRPVCEDSGTGAASSSVTTASEGVTTQTTQTSVQPASTDSGLFHQQTSLTAVQLLVQYPSFVTSACAVRCLATSGCGHFVFLPSTRWCQLYKDGFPTLPLPQCGGEQRCYTKIA